MGRVLLVVLAIGLPLTSCGPARTANAQHTRLCDACEGVFLANGGSLRAIPLAQAMDAPDADVKVALKEWIEQIEDRNFDVEMEKMPLGPSARFDLVLKHRADQKVFAIVEIETANTILSDRVKDSEDGAQQWAKYARLCREHGVALHVIVPEERRTVAEDFVHGRLAAYEWDDQFVGETKKGLTYEVWTWKRE